MNDGGDIEIFATQPKPVTFQEVSDILRDRVVLNLEQFLEKVNEHRREGNKLEAGQLETQLDLLVQQGKIRKQGSKYEKN